MKKWVQRNRLYFIGAAIGAIAGFLYWKFVGCSSGTCAITSNPIVSTIYFSIIGTLVISVFQRKNNTSKQHD